MKIDYNGEKVAVLIGHPNMAESVLNAALAKAANEVVGVKVVNVYDYDCDPSVYADLIKGCTAIVYQFPLYWMSAPHMLKKWTDEVFMRFAIDGDVRGKKFMVITTTGAPESEYGPNGTEKYTMVEFLRPYEGQAYYAGMEWVDPIIVYGDENPEITAAHIAQGCDEYKLRLSALAK